MKNTDDIQNEIERTRDEMATTLDAIERKLNPRQLMDQAVDTMKELASDQSRIGTVVRDNPIPLALIGLGIGWLALSGAMGRREGAKEYSESYGSYEGSEVGSAWGASTGLESTRGSDYAYASGAGTSGYGEAGGYEMGAFGETKGYGGNGGTSAEGRIGRAKESMRQGAESTRRKVSQWRDTARSQASQAADRTWEAYQEHPITMGVVAAILGAAIGALLPRTRTESEVMGEPAAQALREARSAGETLMDRAGRVAQRAVDKAKEELVEGAKTVRDTAKDEADRQGLTGQPPSSMTH
jgi:ElaB/YqjD/DUF883 family membrane-anchored ribosome-binding protein